MMGSNREAFQMLEAWEAKRLETKRQIWVIAVVCLVIVIAAFAHIFLVDAKHPERWGEWYHNPRYEIPWCGGGAAVMVLLLTYSFWENQRRAKGVALLRRAFELADQGLVREGDKAFRKGCHLMGIKSEV